MDTDDAALLQRFRQTRDGAAFQALVARHAPMVHGVAWRRTGNQALSEEITQTVFTILVRKAASLHHSALAGWLHRAAFLETRNACRRESRRQAALRKLAAMPDMSPDFPAGQDPLLPNGSDWEQLQPHVDQALSRLRPDERQLVVLRYFEQRSYREIAQVTGKSEEASRKQMQRSLDRLGIHLRRHGILTTGTALGAVLGGQTLCTPSAPAAAISAAALQGGSVVTITTLLTHTLYTISTATILKTTAITVLVAALPLGWLWTENQSLKQDVAILRAEAAARPVPVGPIAFNNPPGGVKSAPRPGTVQAAARAAASPPDAPAADADGFGALFNADTIVKLAESQMKQDAETELNRLGLRLKLSAEQKEKLSAFLHKEKAAELDQLKKIQSAGMLDKAFKNPEGMSAEDRAALASLDTGDTSAEAPATDEFLKTLLTPEQQEEYTQSEKERRVSETEAEANGVVQSLAQQMDLTPDQKDRLFQGVADIGMKRGQGAATATDTSTSFSMEMGPPGGHGGASSPDVSLLNADPQYDALLKGVLTHDQYATWQTNRAREVEHGREVLKSFMPGAAAAAEAGDGAGKP